MAKKVNPEYELDKDAMLAQMKSMLDSQFALQKEYFELLAKMHELDPYIRAMGDNLMKMSMADQVLYLRQIVKATELAAKLVDKYGFNTEEEEEKG